MESQDRVSRPISGLGKNGSAAGKMHSRGLTNGMSNGMKKGLVNGHGISNGLTNGLTNGLPTPKIPEHRRKPPRKRNLAIIVVLLLILISAYTPYMLERSGGSDRDIDGAFTEWISPERDRAGNSSPDLRAYASQRYRGGIEFYAEAEELFMDNSTLRALIDADSSPSTGYLFRGIGADYLVEISGRGGEVLSSLAYEFNDSRSQDDWNGFNPYGYVPCALSGEKIEFGLPIFREKYDAYIIYSDFDGHYDVSDSPVTGIYCTFEGSSQTTISGKSRFGTVKMESHGEHSIESIEFGISGTCAGVSAELVYQGRTVSSARSAGDSMSFVLDAPLTIDGVTEMEVWVSGDDSGSTLEMELRDVEADCGTVASGNSGYHYMGHMPGGIVIDGGFDDWIGKEVPSPESADNPNIDVEAHALETDGNELYFYIRVRGEMFNGTEIPRTAPIHLPSKRDVNITVGHGRERPLPPEEGRDLTYAFLNTDGDPNTGNPIYGGAEIMIRFSGRDGMEEKKAFLWKGRWTEADVPVYAYAHGDRMEASISVSGNISIYYYMVDWSGEETVLTEMKDTLPSTRIFINNDFQISYNDGQNATRPDIAVDPKDPNYIYAVWSEIDETTGIWEIHFSMSDNGGKNWSNDEATEGDRIISASKRAQVSSVGNATMPAIVVDSYENIHVIWREDYGDGSDEIHYSYSTDFGKTWSSDSGLDWLVSHRYDRPGSLDGEITSLDLAIVTDGNGDVYLYSVWTEFIKETNEQEVRYSWSQGGLGKNWSAADGSDDTIISFPDGQRANNVSITAYPVSGTPNIFVAWDEVDENTGMSEIHYSSSLDGGKTWSGAERDQILSYPAKDGRNARNPSISGAEGVLFALWQQEYDPSQGYLWTEIFYSISTDNGGTWSGQEGDKYISYPDKNPALNVSAAIIPGTKEAHAVWQEYAEEYGSVEIHHSYFDGTSWSGTKADEILSNPDGENATNPSMVWSPAGRMEIVWSEPNPPKASSFNDEIIYSNPVPEFGNIFVPVLSVLLMVFLVFQRKRRNK